MAGEEKVMEALRDKVAEELMKAAYASKAFDKNSPQDILVLTALTELTYGTLVFIVETAKSGGKIDKASVTAYLVKRFSSQFKMLDSKAIDCAFALGSFAIDAAVLGPIIMGAYTASSTFAASGMGAPVALPVLVSALVASAYLVQQSLDASKTCTGAIVEINQKLKEKPATGTVLRIDAPMLSENAVKLFENLAKKDPSALQACPVK
ncbi:hypothetical protein [Belnapia sp. F-4-1]|uniref:hypothetical protein n=1 Tax=Belnapia sp. F-4-1 TaxID=1545443 RepID=UPI00118658C9|nr:hypothetical protein [Belnapia sp. F-4-1]